MNLSAEEIQFLTAILREQRQAGSSGPAHELLRTQAYPDLPASGPGSCAFTYEINPLTTLLLDGLSLPEIDDFLWREAPAPVVWPWSSTEVFRGRLEEARTEWAMRTQSTPQRAAPARRPA
jgi:hypothetical protein